MRDKYSDLRRHLDCLGVKYYLNERLSSYSTFKIGGSADFLVMPENIKTLTQIISYAADNNIKYVLIGNGSNILFSDDGYAGLVISTKKMDKISLNNELIVSECGAQFTKMSIIASNNSLSGLEFAYGIPGTCGGAVFMNAGAYGSEISNVLESVTVYDSISKKVFDVQNKDLNFSYRHSIFQTKENWIVLEAKIRLHPGNQIDIKNKMDANMSSRRSKQPLDFPNIGSIFKRYDSFFMGQIIEQCGFKGHTIGGAQVSEKHAGFIVNVGSATSEDVLSLISKIQDTVKQKYGFIPECEIRYIK